jgi:selenocysteine-specific elongation factor
MKLLGISRGIVAVTKADLSDEEMIEVVEEEIADLVADSFLEGASVIRVSSKTGEGLDAIRELIAHAVDEQTQKSEDGLFRFPIDRVFTMKGFGTVVTGTVFSGSISEDEPVIVLPTALSARARQLQNHNVKLNNLSAGMRGSLNLAGLAVQDINRGDTLVRPGTAEPTHLVDANIRLLQSAPRPLKKTTTVKLYLATSQRPARMTLVGPERLEPGESCYARFRLSQPICAFPGDRLVIRGESPEFTIGGGVVLDVAPSRARARSDERHAFLEKLDGATPEDAASAFLAQGIMGVGLGALARRAGMPAAILEELLEKRTGKDAIRKLSAGDETLLISTASFEALAEKLCGELKAFFDSQPHRLFMPREELRSRLGPDLAPQLFEIVLASLIEQGRVVSTKDGVSLGGRKAQITPAQQKAKEQMEGIFRDAACSPPTFSQAQELSGDLKTAKLMLSLLLEEGSLVKISPTLAYHRDNLDPALDKIRVHFDSSDTLAIGDLKTLLAVSRKHAVPLLEYFDKVGLTRRVGDHRVLKENSRK